MSDLATLLAPKNRVTPLSRPDLTSGPAPVRGEAVDRFEKSAPSYDAGLLRRPSAGLRPASADWMQNQVGPPNPAPGPGGPSLAEMVQRAMEEQARRRTMALEMLKAMGLPTEEPQRTPQQPPF